jgi:hypothetical protein
MAGRDLATLSKQDEARYLKALAERETRDQKDEEKKRMKNLNSKNHNRDILMLQI